MNTKKCFKCKKTKPLDKFYTHKRMADGHLNKCISCTKKDAEKRYNDPEAIKRIIAYEKERWKNPKRRKKTTEYQRKRRLKSGGKYRARLKVANALKYGRIKKMPCEVCGKEKVEAHHDDYRRYLSVRWLCRKHHLELEGKKTYD